VVPRHAVLSIPGGSPRTAFVDDGETRVRYHVAGPAEAPPVVLLHGGGVDAAAVSWKRAVPALAGRYRVYAPDWPGYGDSDPPASTPTLSYYADAFTAFLDAVDVDAAAVAGVSLGGGVALASALAAPARVTRLALLGSYGLGSNASAGAEWLFGPLADALWATARRSRPLVAAGVRAATADVPPDLIAEAWALARRPGAGDAWRAFQRAEATSRGSGVDLPARLGDLGVPALLLHGAQDRLVPLDLAERAAERIPDGRLVVLDCGHWTTRERPTAVNEHLSAFFAAAQSS
jgi:pimeloyl-ACP methyl ester carboxylesterase